MQLCKGWTFGRKIQKEVLFSLLCLAVFYVFAHRAAFAQYHTQAPATQAGSSSTAQEITVTGTIQQLQSTRVGIHLLVDSAQGSLDAPLGPTLSPEIQKSLTKGAPVQVTGVFRTIDGKQPFEVHKVTVSGNQIVIRNEHGFLVHARKPLRASADNSALYGGTK